MRFAVVGSGIAGLGTAWLLQKQGHAVTVFGSERRAGGHTHTVDVSLDGITHPVDTGFLVFNDRTYPHLIGLFAELGVPSVASEMSSSLRDDGSGLEWAGTNLATLFARPANALSPAFWSMLADILRFNRETTAALAAGTLPAVTLGAYLDAQRYRRPFRHGYLVPMAAAIWSSPAREILDFPAIDLNRSSTRKEELLLDEDTLNKVWVLRKFLSDMNPVEGMEFLVDRMAKTKNNERFLDSMKR